MWRKFSFLIISLFAIAFRTIGQHENTMHFMQSIPQSVYNNPAFVPNYKVSVGLPGISSNYIAFTNTSFSYKDVITRGSDDSLRINLNDVYNKLGDKNFIKIATSVDLFSLGFKASPRMHFTFNITEKVYTRLMLPKGLFWAIPGNSPGGTIQMAPAFDAMHYREYGIGASYKVDERLTLGARVKMLYGKGNVHTQNTNASLTTGTENYDLTLKSEAIIHTAGFNRFDNETNKEKNGIDANVYDYLFNKNNKGFAIDLGATYKIMDRLTLGLSIVDLGSIKWKDDVKNYSLDGNKATYSFKGIDIKNENDFDNISDTLDLKFKFKETTSAYKTGLPTKFYFSGNYLLRRNCYLGLILFGEIYQKKFSPSFSAAFTKDFGRRISWSLSYTAANRSYNQIGTGLAFKLFPVQLYIISDNVLGAALSPKATRDCNLRIGMNLIFGRVKTEERQSYK